MSAHSWHALAVPLFACGHDKTAANTIKAYRYRRVDGEVHAETERCRQCHNDSFRQWRYAQRLRGIGREAV